MSIKSRLKAIEIIGQRKPFYRQRIPEPSCAIKETVDIDIRIKPRNDRNYLLLSIIYYLSSTRITSGSTTRMRNWNQFSQFKYHLTTKIIPIEKTYAC